MSLLVAIVCLLLPLSQADDALYAEWRHWLRTYDRDLSDSVENVELFAVWAANMEAIQAHNDKAHLYGYRLAMNQFGDLRLQQFIESYQCVQTMSPTNASQLNIRHNTTIFRDGGSVAVGADLPDTMDWRTSGVVTKVKDQLRCGSSYAFSAMGSLEGLHALAYRNLVKLSEQNIVDCSVSVGNHGCACGEVNKALLYVIENGGVDTWDGYPSGGDPYRSKQYACSYDPASWGASARGIVVLPSGSESSLQSAVGGMGPVSVYVDATSTAFQFYSEGVLNVQYCSNTELSHALVVIGYGSLGGQDYWLVKNSWGPNWGIRGFGLLARNKGNHCGIATSASLPSL